MVVVSESVAQVRNRLGTSFFLCYYAVISGNSLPTFGDNLSVMSSSVKNSNQELLTLEDATDRLS